MTHLGTQLGAKPFIYFVVEKLTWQDYKRMQVQVYNIVSNMMIHFLPTHFEQAHFFVFLIRMHARAFFSVFEILLLLKPDIPKLGFLTQNQNS